MCGSVSTAACPILLSLNGVVFGNKALRSFSPPGSFDQRPKSFLADMFQMNIGRPIFRPGIRRESVRRRLQESGLLGQREHDHCPIFFRPKRRKNLVVYTKVRMSVMLMLLRCGHRQHDSPCCGLVNHMIRAQGARSAVPSFDRSALRQWRLKYCTAFSCFLAAERVLNVPRFLRLPVFGFFFREYNR